MSILNIIRRPGGKRSNTDKWLDEVVYRFRPSGDVLTMRDYFASFGIFGGVGGGKTSGPAAHLFLAGLRKNMGAVCFSVKSSETSWLKKLIKLAGREKDMVVFSKDIGLSFSLLEYELNRQGNGAGELDNIINMLMQIYQLGKNYKAGGSSESKDKFWDDAMLMAVKSCIQLLLLAGEPVTIRNMRKVLVHAFNEGDLQRYNNIWAILRDERATDEAKEQQWRSYKDWCAENYFLGCFDRINSNERLGTNELETLEMLGDYWLKGYPLMSERTTSIVVEMFHALVDPFMDGVLKQHFSNGVSRELLPERTYLENKIIIIDFPVKEYGLAGVYAAGIYKLCFQQAMERRVLENETNPTGVMLYADEVQNILSPSYDTQFVLTARSCAVSCIFITQSIHNISFAMGHESPREKAKAMLSNLSTRVFCNNSCVETNTWGAELVGKADIKNTSSTLYENKGGNKTFNHSRKHKVPSEHFSTLKTGSSNNKYTVEAIVHKSGKAWRNGENFLEARFDQRLK